MVTAQLIQVAVFLAAAAIAAPLGRFLLLALLQLLQRLIDDLGVLQQIVVDDPLHRLLLGWGERLIGRDAA